MEPKGEPKSGKNREKCDQKRGPKIYAFSDQISDPAGSNFPSPGSPKDFVLGGKPPEGNLPEGNLPKKNNYRWGAMRG